MMGTLAVPTYSLKTASRLVKKAKGADYLAECLADNGQVYPRDFPGYIYVREILSVDATTGSMTRGETYLVRAHRNFLPAYGVRVRVTYDDFYDDWVILENDPDSLVEQKLNPAILNQLNPWSNVIDLSGMGPLLTYAVSGGNTASTEVSVKNFAYTDYLGAQKLFRLDGASRPDMATYEPAAGTKRLAHLWLNHDNTLSVSQSTPISSALDFQPDIDLKEVIEDRPDQLAVPIGAWIVKNGLSEITPADRYEITRPWLNTVQYAGFPTPVNTNYRVPSGVQETVCGSICINSPGNLYVQGIMYVL